MIVELEPNANLRRRGAQQQQKRAHVGLFGCPLDTGNMGVSALGLATLSGLARTTAEPHTTVFDYGDGVRPRELTIGDVRTSSCFVGCYHSRRYYRADNTVQMYLAARMGLAHLHPMLRRLRELDAILDISGGDSFSDIYGPRRFAAMALTKQIALALGRPLILLPQTYGPYRARAARARARAILLRATQVWARDQRSLEVVADMLGSAFDPRRHLCGVDVAFGLPAAMPTDELRERVLHFRSLSGTLVGINVSGLLFNRPGDDVQRFGFRDSYRATVKSLLARMLNHDGVRVLLVPHVAPSRASVDCDASACEQLLSEIPRPQRERVRTLPPVADPMVAKWIIGQCDWFCGTRMHACIAGLSQGVPTTAIAYSDKTLGVFATAGVADCVVDPRLDGTAQIVDQIDQSFRRREEVRARLQQHLPQMQSRLADQFRRITEVVA